MLPSIQQEGTTLWAREEQGPSVQKGRELLLRAGVPSGDCLASGVPNGHLVSNQEIENLTRPSSRWIEDGDLSGVYRQGRCSSGSPIWPTLILNPSLRWVPPEPDSTNQGDRSNTMNTSGAGSGRQREQERREKKKSSRDKITSQDRRLRGSGAGNPAQESALATPSLRLGWASRCSPSVTGAWGEGPPRSLQ